MIVADTDVLIDAMHGEPSAVAAVSRALEQDLATTAVTAFELLSGARRERVREAVEQLLAPLRILALDAAAAERAAAERRGLEDAGARLAMADCLIAGICLVHSASLLTRNRRHFERVEGLVLAEF